MISANQLIGSVVYLTREALAKDQDFLTGIEQYPYSGNCFTNGQFNLWHYPGTFNEISEALLLANNHPKGEKIKFPSVLSFQPIKQTISGRDRTINYQIAFIGKTHRDLSTPERESDVFNPLLRPVYAEFVNQLKHYFDIGYNGPAHDYYEVFTTGNNKGVLVEVYGDYIDAIELHNFRLSVKNICDKRVISTIEKHNTLVTKRLSETINE